MNENLFEILTAEHPAPWAVNYWPQAPHHKRQHICDIKDRNGEDILHFETHTGDGDQIYISEETLEKLVVAVNEEAARRKT